MFKCEKCEVSDHKPIRVVTERIMVTHKDGAQGSQIAKEVSVCVNCLPYTPEAVKPARVVVEKTPYSASSALSRSVFEHASVDG